MCMLKLSDLTEEYLIEAVLLWEGTEVVLCVFLINSDAEITTDKKYVECNVKYILRYWYTIMQQFNNMLELLLFAL